MVKNTNITYNYAGVAGGFIFFKNTDHNLKKFLRFLKQDDFNNNIEYNKAKSHGDDFATHPSNFSINYDNNINTEIYSGGFVSLTLTLKDSAENLVIDSEKYYSNIGIEAELYDINYNEVNNNNYLISEIDSNFNNGINITLFYITVLNILYNIHFNIHFITSIGR